MADEAVQVQEEAGAVQLARHLNSSRRRPVVVISVPAGRETPYMSVSDVLDGVGGLAEVFVLHNGVESWAFSREMAPHTQVYGGAGGVHVGRGPARR